MKNNSEIFQFEKAIDRIVIKNRKSESLSSALYNGFLFEKQHSKTKNYFPNNYNTNISNHYTNKIEISPFIKKFKENDNKKSDFLVETVQNEINFQKNNFRDYKTIINSNLKSNILNNDKFINEIHKTTVVNKSSEFNKNENEIRNEIRDSSFNRINNDDTYKLHSPFRQKGIDEIEKINRLFIKGTNDKININLIARSLNQPLFSPENIVKRDFSKSIGINKLNKIDYLRPNLREKLLN